MTNEASIPLHAEVVAVWEGSRCISNGRKIRKMLEEAERKGPLLLDIYCQALEVTTLMHFSAFGQEVLQQQRKVRTIAAASEHIAARPGEVLDTMLVDFGMLSWQHMIQRWNRMPTVH